LKSFFISEIPGDNSTNPTTIIEIKQEKRREKYYFYYVPASIFLLTILTGLSLYLWMRRKRRRFADEGHLLSEFNSTMSKQPSCPALMLQMIHQGRMSVIWKGTYCQRLVAIKVVNKLEANTWKNEKDLFIEHNLRHQNLVNFICAEKRFHENSIQYWIVTEFYENGSLAEYLLRSVISKDILLKILYSIVKGVVYLHSSSSSSGSKPMVAHRDLKPGNVLVKRDLTCCISDLGLAVALPEHLQVSRDLCQVCFCVLFRQHFSDL